MIEIITGFFNQKHVDEMLKESKKMCNLDHPNVQTLIGVCIDGGPTPYIVMPFMKNGSLLSFLRKNKDTLLLKQGGEEYEVCSIVVRKACTDLQFYILVNVVDMYVLSLIQMSEHFVFAGSCMHF